MVKRKYGTIRRRITGGFFGLTCASIVLIAVLLLSNYLSLSGSSGGGAAEYDSLNGLTRIAAIQAEFGQCSTAFETLRGIEPSVKRLQCTTMFFGSVSPPDQNISEFLECAIVAKKELFSMDLSVETCNCPDCIFVPASVAYSQLPPNGEVHRLKADFLLNLAILQGRKDLHEEAKLSLASALKHQNQYEAARKKFNAELDRVNSILESKRQSKQFWWRIVSGCWVFILGPLIGALCNGAFLKKAESLGTKMTERSKNDSSAQSVRGSTDDTSFSAAEEELVAAEQLLPERKGSADL